MKITLLSNYFNHHQKSICDVLYRLTDGQFSFAAVSVISDMRKALGYREITADYVRDFSADPHTAALAKLLADSDVLIAGAAPEAQLRKQILAGKPVFRYSERLFKNGAEPLKYPLRLLRSHYHNPAGKNLYLLCASAYAAQDYAALGLFQSRAYKWGYFPETVQYDNPEQMIAAKDPARMVFCGRFLDWKHPDDVLRVAARLKENGYRFSVDMIGTGEMEAHLREMTEQYGLSDCVTFPGSMPTEAVRTCMEEAGIFLFTSDRREGWGAVLNEAMNSGCAVAASDAAGASPYLIRDGQNGFLYASGNTKQLYEKVRYLLEHPQEQRRLGMAAYRTITEEWNAEAAGERLCNLARHILNGETAPDLYESGPCSKAYGTCTPHLYPPERKCDKK